MIRSVVNKRLKGISLNVGVFEGWCKRNTYCTAHQQGSMKAKQTLIAEAKMIIRRGNWTDHDASG